IAKKFMRIEEDSLIIFKGASQCSLEKEIIGKECCSIDNFL
ncbi:MAG: CRISPR-associated endonuclease Cas2, partial [Bacteroides sp.]